MTDSRIRYEEALRRANTLSWDQRWQEAIEQFWLAIEAVADEPAPFAGLGNAYLELGQLDEALVNYKKAARLSNGDIVYLKHVADVQERLGHLGDAGQTYMAIGELYLRRKKLNDAVGNWLRAVRLEPDLLGGHQRLAAIYRRQKLTRNAVREYLAMARIYHARGDRSQALEMCRTALELDPRNADVLTAVELIQRGESFLEEHAFALDGGTTADAEGMEEAVEQIATSLGKGAARLGKEDRLGGLTLVQAAQKEALEELAREILTEDDNGDIVSDEPGLSKLERDALISQALDFQTRGMIEEAISCYQKAIDGGVSSPAAHFCLGTLYHRQEKLGQAIRHLQFSLHNPGYYVAGNLSLGDAYQARGSLDRSINHYVDALRVIEMEFVGENERERVSDLYDRLVDELLQDGQTERVHNFTRALSDLFHNPDWRQQIERLQARLDRLSTDRQKPILGEIMTAGSVGALESLHLSQDYASQDKYDSAIEEAYRVIQLAPYYMPGHIQLAELIARQDRHDIAAAKFQIIGETYSVRKNASRAIDSYERAVELAPMDMAARDRLIELLINKNQIDRALEHYIAKGEAYYSLANLEQARDSYGQALKLLSHGSADKKWRLRLLRAIADLDMQRLDWRKALAAYRELNQIAPEDEGIAMNMVDLLFKAGQSTQAVKQLDQLLIQLVRSGQSGRIAGILREFVDAYPGNPLLVNRLAELYNRQGRQGDAVSLLDRLGEIQLEAGAVDQAKATINRIIALNPLEVDKYRQLLMSISEEGE